MRCWRRGAVALAAAVGVLAGCTTADPFTEPNGVVIWSTDDQPPELPADSPAANDPQMFVDQLRHAIVLADDNEQIVVVGDVYDPTGSQGDVFVEDDVPYRVAYLLEPDGRVVLFLGGHLDGGSGFYSGVPGRRLGIALDPSTNGARVFTSAGMRDIPVYTDPTTGQVLTFVTARDGETLYGLHALDDGGRVLSAAGMAPDA